MLLCTLVLSPSDQHAGYNVCIFAYGQTGSGKTYTMTGRNAGAGARGRGVGVGGAYLSSGGSGGSVDSGGGSGGDERGINYRALEDLFAIRDARRGEVRPRTLRR